VSTRSPGLLLEPGNAFDRWQVAFPWYIVFNRAGLIGFSELPIQLQPPELVIFFMYPAVRSFWRGELDS